MLSQAESTWPVLLMGGSGWTRAAEGECRSMGDMQDLVVERGPTQACWCQCLENCLTSLGLGTPC